MNFLTTPRTDRPVSALVFALLFACTLYILTRSGYVAPLAAGIAAVRIFSRPQDSPTRHIMEALGICVFLWVVWYLVRKAGV